MLKSLKLWSIIVVAFATVGVIAAPVMTGDANYTAGSDYTFTITLGAYDSGVNGVGIDITLPDGWGETTATIVPATNLPTTGLEAALNATNDSLAIGWFKAQGPLPGAAEVLTVTVDVPSGQTGAKTISLKVIYGDTVDTSQSLNLSLPSTEVVVSDFDADGKSDVLALNGSDQTSSKVFFMNGSTSSSDGPIGIPAGWEIFELADFNGDGSADMLLYNDTTKQYYIYLMDGTTVSSYGELGIPAGWTILKTGDFDGDKKADVFLVNDTNANQNYVLKVDGTTVSAIGSINLPSGWSIIDIADFSGDGKYDLLFRNDSNSAKNYIWVMDGNVAQYGDQVNIPSGWTIIKTGDFSGDKKADILFSNDADPSLNYVWTVDCNGTVNYAALGAINIPAGWIMHQRGDYNGDLKTDILFRRTDDVTRNYIWLMDGNAPTGGDPLNVDSGWSVSGK